MELLLFTPQYNSHCMENSSVLVQSPVKMIGAFLMNLSIWCGCGGTIAGAAGAIGGPPPPPNPPPPGGPGGRASSWNSNGSNSSLGVSGRQNGRPGGGGSLISGPRALWM